MARVPEEMPALDDRTGDPRADPGAILPRAAQGHCSIGEGVVTPVRSICIAALLTLGAPAVAQEAFPSRPIKFVVPLAAGGGIDFTARVTAQKLSEVIGQQVVVENQGGGGGSIGVNQVVKAPPDGYMLL